jgi:hypothetical protein
LGAAGFPLRPCAVNNNLSLEKVLTDIQASAAENLLRLYETSVLATPYFYGRLYCHYGAIRINFPQF